MHIFSIIIPVYNNRLKLQKCLSALCRCVVPDGWFFEVIVVDDGSSESLRDIVQDFGFRYARIERSGQAVARNEGMRYARGDVIAFLDSDCIPESQWISEAILRLSDYDIVVGRLLHKRSFLGNLIALIHFGAYSGNCSYESDMFCTGSVAMKAAVLKGRRFENVPEGEDILLSWRMRRAGYRIVYHPLMAVFHDTSISWHYLMDTTRRQARAAVYTRHHDSSLPGGGCPRVLWAPARLVRDIQRLFAYRSDLRIGWVYIPVYISFMVYIRFVYFMGLSPNTSMAQNRAFCPRIFSKFFTNITHIASKFVQTFENKIHKF